MGIKYLIEKYGLHLTNIQRREVPGLPPFIEVDLVDKEDNLIIDACFDGTETPTVEAVLEGCADTVDYLQGEHEEDDLVDRTFKITVNRLKAYFGEDFQEILKGSD